MFTDVVSRIGAEKKKKKKLNTETKLSRYIVYIFFAAVFLALYHNYVSNCCSTIVK